mgnify:CR=1 FL=1
MLREMTPIQGLSKAKRLSWFGPQNLVSYTYMKRLREHDDTRRVYDCDPYVEVYQFRGNLYGLFVPNCDGAGDVWQWLTIGPEKCLLVSWLLILLGSILRMASIASFRPGFFLYLP